MAASSNVGSTNSGNSRRTSSSGGRAGSVASSLSKTLSACSNAEVNSSETSSGSFSCMTTTTGSGSEAAVAAPMETTGGSGGGLRRAASAGGKNKKRFVGVRQRPSGRWVAEIKDTTQKIRLWLGTFDTAEDAARAYDEAAWLLRGANTRTNFVPSTSTDASVLPSKAARLLQLRRNAAAGTASSQENSSGAAATPVAAPATAPVNSKPSQTQSGTSAGNKLEGNVNLNSIESCLPKSPPLPSLVVVLPSPDGNSKQATSMGSRVPAPPALVTAASAASTSPYRSSSIGHVSDFSAEVSKSESSYESSVEEMCGIAEAPGLNNNGPALFQPDLGGSMRRNDQSTTIVNVKQELVTSTYQQPLAEPSPIRGNRKEKDYCSEAPQQESFVDDTDMSSGLSGLEDVDLSCADSVYSSPFDFSADMGPGFLISSPLSADLATGEDDSLTEHMRRMSYERQISAGLYAINGVHECLSLSHSWGQSSWNGGLSSPSLTMTAGFRRSTSGPFLTGSPAGWKSAGASGTSGNNGSGSWATTSQQQQPTSSGPSAVNGNNGTNNSTVAENAECPSQDALWQSWDLPPLCVVA